MPLVDLTWRAHGSIADAQVAELAHVGDLRGVRLIVFPNRVTMPAIDPPGMRWRAHGWAWHADWAPGVDLHPGFAASWADRDEAKGWCRQVVEVLATTDRAQMLAFIDVRGPEIDDLDTLRAVLKAWS